MYPPGYFACKTIIKDLQKFQDLVRHHQRRAHQIGFARPLPELIPGLKEKDPSTPELIKREINRLIPIVRRYLKVAGIEHQIQIRHTQEQREYDFEKNIPKFIAKERQYDLIRDYFEIPHSGASFDLVMSALDRGIGYYSDRQKWALIEMFNPIFWIAFTLRIPFLVLQFAGIETEGKILAGIYGFLIKTIMMLILVLIAAKLGISIPWERLLTINK